jgi:hypothetical protein
MYRMRRSSDMADMVGAAQAEAGCGEAQLGCSVVWRYSVRVRLRDRGSEVRHRSEGYGVDKFRAGGSSTLVCVGLQYGLPGFES